MPGKIEPGESYRRSASRPPAAELITLNDCQMRHHPPRARAFGPLTGGPGQAEAVKRVRRLRNQRWRNFSVKVVDWPLCNG